GQRREHAAWPPARHSPVAKLSPSLQRSRDDGTSMRIGIETSVLRMNRVGSAVYTRHLVSHLQECSSGHHFSLYAFGTDGDGAIRKRAERVLRDTGWMHGLLPWRIWRDRLDVFHATAYSAPLASPCPLLLTILDLSIVKHPEWFDHRWFYFYTTM